VNRDSSNRETKKSQDDSDTVQSDVEALQLVVDEGRTTLQRQVQNINEFYRDTIRAFQIYFGLLGILFTIYRLDTSNKQISSLINAPTIVGCCLFCLSVTIALAIYAETNPLAGIGSEGIAAVRKGNYSHQEYLFELASFYENWIGQNADLNRMLSILNFLVLILLIISFALLTYGLIL